MTYLNTAAGRKAEPLPVKEYHVDTPVDQYDLNFCFPVKVLESNGVRLEPFIPSLHARQAWEIFNSPAGEGVYKYIPFSLPDTWAAFLTATEGFRKNVGFQQYAIIDRSHRSGPKLAGCVSYINSSSDNLCTEIGAVFIFPDFQRTHVNSHATGLLLKYAFEDLKLRRVQWRANDLNQASVSAAKRLGFAYEGTMEWDRVIPHGKTGRINANTDGYGSPEAGPGRHSAQLVITWESWLGTVKAHIESMMSREIVPRE